MKPLGPDQTYCVGPPEHVAFSVTVPGDCNVWGVALIEHDGAGVGATSTETLPVADPAELEPVTENRLVLVTLIENDARGSPGATPGPVHKYV